MPPTRVSSGQTGTNNPDAREMLCWLCRRVLHVGFTVPAPTKLDRAVASLQPPARAPCSTSAEGPSKSSVCPAHARQFLCGMRYVLRAANKRRLSFYGTWGSFRHRQIICCMLRLPEMMHRERLSDASCDAVTLPLQPCFGVGAWLKFPDRAAIAGPGAGHG